MKIDVPSLMQVAEKIAAFGRAVILVLLLGSVFVIMLKSFGVPLPAVARTLGHIELAYLAGVYWLTK